MKIAFPVQDDRGEESIVYGHFGSARFFVIADSNDGALESRPNKDREHAHGQCQPLAALGVNVDAVVVGGIGAGALSKLQAEGVKVYRAVEGTVQENMELITSGRLPEFTLEQTCAGHGHGGGCVH